MLLKDNYQILSLISLKGIRKGNSYLSDDSESAETLQLANFDISKHGTTPKPFQGIFM